MINKILQKHDGFTNYWYPEVTEPNLYVNSDTNKKYSIGCSEKEFALQNKWQSYVPQGWYGFSLGSPCPSAWYEIINEFLEYLVELQRLGKVSKLAIHQIKLKLGGCRFYVSYVCEEDELREFIGLQIDKLENHLFDEKLIY